MGALLAFTVLLEGLNHSTLECFPTIHVHSTFCFYWFLKDKFCNCFYFLSTLDFIFAATNESTIESRGPRII